MQTLMICASYVAFLVTAAVALGQQNSAAQPATAEPDSALPGADQPLDGQQGRDLLLRNFRPRPMLKVPQHHLTHASFPVIDVHTHFRHRLRHSQAALDAFVGVMNTHNIAVCVSLDGQLGGPFEEHQEYLWSDYPNRFAIFVNIDWMGAGNPDDPGSWDAHRPEFARTVARQLADAKAAGSSGLKLFKQFGLHYKNPDGSLIAIDDPRWDPIWEACGELGLPVLIHTADPAAFFLPIDQTNERWEELSRHPEWSFYGKDFPSREQLLKARNRVIARHPNTIFIGAHVANNAEDLATVSQWLERYPNLYIELASRISELGRQPYTSRAFFLRYADRILFGTDGPWPPERLSLYWRFLETYDEYFPYSEKVPPPQGLWQIYGLGLPEEVLRKVYHENALRILPGLQEKYNAALLEMNLTPAD